MPPRQCRHLPEADSQEVGNPTKDARGKHSCEHLQKYLFKKSSNGNISMLRGLQDSCIYKKLGNRYFSCLDCGVCAYSPNAFGDLHNKKEQKTHNICVDCSVQELYCLACNDYVYSKEFDDIVYAVKKQRRSFKKKDFNVVNESDGRETAKPSAPTAGGSPARRNHSWESESTEDGIVVAERGPVCDGNEKFTCILPRQDELPLGLRGMNNMGNTCFMNSILQALLRTPTLSEYYLQSRHFKGNCRVTMEGGHCVECELDAVISDIFSGGRAPYSPTNFLHSWWMMAGGLLSGYKQQDSHEFFLFILQMLTGHPRSIATSLFIGHVQSEISCGLCGSVKSRQRDEFSHVSLDVISSKSLLPPPIVPRSLVRDSRANGGKRARGRPSRAKTESTKMNGKDDSQISQTNTSLENRTNFTADADASFSVEAGDVLDTLSSQSQSQQTVQNASQISQQKSLKVEDSHPSLQGYLRWPGDSLIGCLKRFTWPEVLDKATHSFTCSECQASSASTKQFSFLKLPPILTFHFKRFEHTGSTGAKATKLETFISFPLNSLDMQPFLASRMSLINEDIVPQEGQTRGNTYYDAFAVVCHRGTFQGGHYVCYVRCDDNNWYLCDDAYVAQVSEDVVRNCQAYMVFYSLQTLCPWRLQGKN